MLGSIGFLAALIACSTPAPPPPAPAPAPVEAPAPPPAPKAVPGKLPIEYPALGTSAAAGDMVLAPNRDVVDKAWSDGLDKQTFIFYMATMEEPGPAESKVKSLSGTEYMIPNSLLIPLPKGATAAAGDILLGHWESGSGMQRAIAVDVTTPTAPKVRYLDDTYKADDKPDTWQADRFEKLEAGHVGVTVACKLPDNSVDHGILVSMTPKKVLSLGFAGKLSMYDVASCTPLPPKPAAMPKAGDKIQVPYLGTYREATVTKIEGKNGRVFAKFDFGGAPKEEAFGLQDITPAFTTWGEGFVMDEGAKPDREGKAGKAGKGGDEGGGEGKAGKEGKGGKAKAGN